MVTPNQLNGWLPGNLETISDDLAAHRKVLLEQTDELAFGKVPPTWTFESAIAAARSHKVLSDALAIQVAETTTVIAALDTAAKEIRAAKNALSDAYEAASYHNFEIDGTTGAVRVLDTFDNSGDAQYAYTQANYVRQSVSNALTSADSADQKLAAVLNTAVTSDVNAIGSLDKQRDIMEFQELTETQQVQYLLDHPDEFTTLGPYASDEVKQAVGQQLATEFDALAKDATLLLDDERADRAADLIEAFGTDPVVMSTMYERFGPEGTLGLLSSVSASFSGTGEPDDLVRLAEGLRTGLQSASQDPDFASEAYARDMVRYATYQMPEADLAAFNDTYPYANQANASVLDFLLREGEYSEDFVRGTVWEFDAFERAYPQGALDWALFNSVCPLDGIGLSMDDWPYEADPMAQAMGQLGNHPELGLEFFTNPDDGNERMEFYLSERDWSRDGFAGISEAVLGIGTDPDNITNATAATHGLVGEFFDRIPDRDDFDADNAGASAEPIGRLLKNYMPAVELAQFSSQDVDPAFRSSRNPFLPDLPGDYPMMNKDDLDGLLKVVLTDEQGMARIAEGIAGLRQEQLNQIAQQYDGAPGESGVVMEALKRSAVLEGYMQHAVADIAIEGAVSKDQQVAVFTDLVSEAIGFIPGGDLVGEGAGYLAKEAWGAAWNHISEIPSDTITESFGNNESVVRAEQDDEALLGREKMLINAYLSAVQAGVVDLPPDMASTWRPGGDLISLAEIPQEQISQFYADAYEEWNGDPYSATDLNTAYKDPFNGWTED